MQKNPFRFVFFFFFTPPHQTLQSKGLQLSFAWRNDETEKHGHQ